MPTEALKKFAEELKQTREAKEITLKSISNRTKIDIKYLQAIENCNLSILPDLYIREFIKEYAQVLDLNVKEIIKKYDNAKLGKIESKNTEVAEESEELKSEKEDQLIESVEENVEFSANIKTTDQEFHWKKFFKKYLFPIGFLFFLALLILVYYLFIKESSQEIITESTFTESTSEINARFEVDSSLSGEVVPKDDSLRLSLSASARVWIKIICDKKEVLQGFVDKDKSISYKAIKEFRVVVGNAGLVSMELNNNRLTLIGNRGEIRSYNITADTVKSFLISVPTKNENRSNPQN
ncbi:MAG: helix-turn-helix domain-containing protein [Ignavibacteria bacterium]|nr:helix-turn-helix domain-containing protein [Ignavibacteria bacterium]